MLIIPAIDLRQGKCVRLSQGRKGATKVYDTDPVEVAKRFETVDLALMPICPIAPAEEMIQHHMNPTQAVEATSLLKASVMAPIHFETFVNSLDHADDCRGALQKVANASSGMPKIVMWHIGESIVVR